MGIQFPTCCITNLPILDGVEAVQLLLLPGRNHPHREASYPSLGAYEGSSYGPTAFYQPFLWPIHGVHNGYGGLWTASEGDPEPVVAAPNLFHRLLFDEAQHTTEEYPETPIYEPLQPMSLSDLLQRRAYFHHPVKLAGIPLYSTLVRMDVWTALLDIKDFGIRQGAIEYVEEMPTDLDPCEGLRRLSNFEITDNPFCNAGLDLGLAGLDIDLIRAPHADVQQATLALADLYHINAYLDLARRFWCPMTGAGSQDCETDHQAHLAELTLKLV
jgi:hypothetical protein